MKLSLNWSVGFCENENARPTEFFEACVPGAVQLDYAAYKNLPDYKKGLNFKEYKWMEDKFWVYKAEFDSSYISLEEDIFLVVKGIDYKYDIYANGKKLLSYEGMYRSHRLSLTEFIGKRIEIEIVVYPVPKSTLPGVHKDTRDEANQCCKPTVSYGWDFHPRLEPLGIWDDIYIEEIQRGKSFEAEVSYELSEELDRARVFLNAECKEAVCWEFFDPEGNLIYSGKGNKLEFTVNDVKLWWCNAYGEQPLYSWTAHIDGEEPKVRKLGFKRVEIVKAEGSWNENLNYPMSRNTPPITVRLNNTVIFAKGSNWVAPEIFYGTLDGKRYREQLMLVKKANLNFLRCWGGAVINKESFFQICDELGIMIFQEFPLACNHYQNTKHYISVLGSEAEAIIDRVKSHVCLMLWCGGNELFNNWSVMTEQYKAIRLMNSLTYQRTPEIPFISTAPVMGMAHGPYSFNFNDGSEIMQVLPSCRNTAYTEFGGPGYSTVETLKLIGETDEIYPFDGNEISEAHGTHFKNLPIEKYFGKVDNIDGLIKCGQFLQCVGQQFIFEEGRRQKPYCSMVSNWCFNEPWPNTGNNSVLSYPNNIKPVYYAISSACRSVLASARYRKLVYKAGETLDFDLYLLNDSLKKVDDGTVNVFVKVGNRENVFLLKWDYNNVPICANIAGPTVRYKLPVVEDADTLEIILECGEYSSKYTLLYRLPEAPANAPKKMNAILDENA